MPANDLLWYRVADEPPPMQVRVRVCWDGRVFEAARVISPRTGREVWLTYDRSHGAVILPINPASPPRDPDKPWGGWHLLRGDAPQLYQPLDARTWRARLPAPCETATVSSGPGVVSTPWAGDGEGGHSFGQWWRDASALVYEAPGDVSLRMCEGRVMRAIAWSGAESQWLARHGGKVPLADIAQAMAEVDDRPTITYRFRPLEQDRKDFLTAMGWFTQLGQDAAVTRQLAREQKVLVWRSREVPPSFAEIADLLDLRSAEAARLIYRKALKGCITAANAPPGTVSAAVMALRRRNRQHAEGNR